MHSSGSLLLCVWFCIWVVSFPLVALEPQSQACQVTSVSFSFFCVMSFLGAVLLQAGWLLCRPPVCVPVIWDLPPPGLCLCVGAGGSERLAAPHISQTWGASQRASLDSQVTLGESPLLGTGEGAPHTVCVSKSLSLKLFRVFFQSLEFWSLPWTLLLWVFKFFADAQPIALVLFFKKMKQFTDRWVTCGKWT